MGIFCAERRWPATPMAMGCRMCGSSKTALPTTQAPLRTAMAMGGPDYQELKGGWSPRDVSSVPLHPPQTKPLAAVLANAGTLTSLGYVVLRLWDAEGNPATPFFSYQVAGSTNWQTATIVTLDGATYSTNSLAAAPPSGTNDTIVWNALADLGPVMWAVTHILLRASAQDVSLMGDWSAGTLFTVNTTLPPPVDGDADGMPDSWEIQSSAIPPAPESPIGTTMAPMISPNTLPTRIQRIPRPSSASPPWQHGTGRFDGGLVGRKCRNPVSPTQLHYWRHKLILAECLDQPSPHTHCRVTIISLELRGSFSRRFGTGIQRPDRSGTITWLLGTNTGRYNRRHKEFGHLFSG